MHSLSLYRSCIRFATCYRCHRMLCCSIPKPLIKSLNLEEAIEKTFVQKSFVSGLFIGLVDQNVLSYPSILIEKSEIDHLKQQQKRIKDHFVDLFVRQEELDDFGFHHLSKLSATEIASVFEAIGMSRLSETSNLNHHYVSEKDPVLSDEYNNHIVKLITKSCGHDNSKALGQLAVSSLLLGRVKACYESCIKHVDVGNALTTTVGLNQYFLYEMIREIYKLESLCYYIAGMIDAFEGRDLSPEGMVVKITSNEVSLRVLSLASKMLGAKLALGREHELLRLYDNFLGSSFSNKVLLGLHGLATYGDQYREEIEKFKANPKEPLRKKKPETSGIDIYFQVSLRNASSALEEMIGRLLTATMSAHRQAIDVKESTAISLANKAIAIVQAIGVLTRASRALVDHLENLDADYVLAEHEAELLSIKTKSGSYATRRELIHEKMLEIGGYYPSSPFLLLKNPEAERKAIDSGISESSAGVKQFELK